MPQQMEKILQEVDSSVIDAVGYSHGLLFVQFVSDSIYVYFGVNFSVYRELFDAHSVGTYYNDCIKGQYESKRIS